MIGLQRFVTGNVWGRLVHERVGAPLHAKHLRSLLVIVPAASGDVALATTVIRHVKTVNPDCRVTFATERSTAALIKMCPGVDDVLEVPHVPRDKLSRRDSLSEYAGRADAVVYTNWCPGNQDLASEYGLNLIESIWLLSGVDGEMPAASQRVWLESDLSPAQATEIIRRSLGASARSRLFARGAHRVSETLTAIFRARTLKGSGIMVVPRDLSGLKNAAEVMKSVHAERLAGGALSEKFVILSTEARSVLPPPPELVQALVAMLRADGRTVLHNVMDPLSAAHGTVPLICSYGEFLCLREAGVPFVGWRSGLCDVAAASGSPMCVLYPTKIYLPEHRWYKDIMTTFGFQSMNVAADCLEIVCGNASDLNRDEILAYLQGNRI